MRSFFDTTFGSAELEILDTVLMEWCQINHISKSDPDAGLTGAILINLFREGNNTVPLLRKAALAHKGLLSLFPLEKPARSASSS